MSASLYIWEKKQLNTSIVLVTFKIEKKEKNGLDVDVFLDMHKQSETARKLSCDLLYGDC